MTISYPTPPNLPQPSRHIFSMIPSVPFSTLSDPIKVFVGLDYTYPLETIFACHSARITFQLEPKSLDILSCLTWKTRRMSLLYCFVVSSQELPPKCIPPKTCTFFLQVFKKKQILISKMSDLKHYFCQKYNENVRRYSYYAPILKNL